MSEYKNRGFQISPWKCRIFAKMADFKTAIRFLLRSLQSPSPREWYDRSAYSLRIIPGSNIACRNLFRPTHRNRLMHVGSSGIVISAITSTPNLRTTIQHRLVSSIPSTIAAISGLALSALQRAIRAIDYRCNSLTNFESEFYALFRYPAPSTTAQVFHFRFDTRKYCKSKVRESASAS
ncbi:hypothetical protein KCP73_19020 [Salmonella enterica subsp. enterica]|nr:hypothetical protein KCP73_19020 [Salmonella enterica subsp. enterica]